MFKQFKDGSYFEAIDKLMIDAYYDFLYNNKEAVREWLFFPFSASGLNFNPRNMSIYSCG